MRRNGLRTNASIVIGGIGEVGEEKKVKVRVKAERRAFQCHN